MQKTHINKLVLFTALIGISFSSYAVADESRTSNRTVNVLNEKRDVHKKEAWEQTLPKVWDPINKHPHQWKKSDQVKTHDWDPKLWDNGNWQDGNNGAEIYTMHYLQNFYKARIFHKQYVDESGHLVLEVGPKFYKLADVDQRRTLKLLADGFKLSERGYNGYKIHDWHSKKSVGNYTSYGLQLY